MRGKKEKTGREKEEKREEKKKKVHAQVFPLRSCHFWDQSEIRYFGKSNLDLLSFSWKTLSMSELGDIQGLNIHPHPHFCNSSEILWQ